jgi:hypothetical protein
MHLEYLFWSFDRLPRANGSPAICAPRPLVYPEETLLDQLERFLKLGLLLYLT